MSEDRFDDELERLEAAERVRDAEEDRALRLVRTGPLAGRLAGTWRSGERLCIGVAVADGDALEAVRRRMPPGVELRAVKRSIGELEQLAQSIRDAGARLGARVTDTAVDPQTNGLEVGVDDLRAAPVEDLRTRFAHEPIDWTDEPIVAVSQT